jgi:hypothetical protein
MIMNEDNVGDFQWLYTLLESIMDISKECLQIEFVTSKMNSHRLKGFRTPSSNGLRDSIQCRDLK